MNKELHWTEKNGEWVASGYGFEYYICSGLQVSPYGLTDSKYYFFDTTYGDSVTEMKAAAQSFHEAISQTIEAAKKESYSQGYDRGVQVSQAIINAIAESL